MMIPRHSDRWTSRNLGNIHGSFSRTLVAGFVNFCSLIREWLRSMSTIQNQQTPDETCFVFHFLFTDKPSVCSVIHGFYHQFTTFRNLRFYHGHGRPWSYEGDNSDTLYRKRFYDLRNRLTFHRKCLQTIRTTR